MNVANIGLFSGDSLGISAAYTYSVAHGFISGGLFILIGILYSRYHTKSMKYYRGLFLSKPLFVIILFFFN